MLDRSLPPLVKMHKRIFELAHTKADSWLHSAEAEHLRQIASYLNVSELVTFLNFGDADASLDVEWCLRKIMLGFFGSGTADGHAQKNDPIAQIFIFYICAYSFSDRNQQGKLVRASTHDFVVKYPQESAWVFSVLMSHACLVQNATQQILKDERVRLYRGVDDPKFFFPLESWSLQDSVSSYGSMKLTSDAHVSHILSVRAQECEIVLSRLSLSDFVSPLQVQYQDSIGPNTKDSNRKKGSLWRRMVRIAADAVLDQDPNPNR
ncbi:hypothetical protein [Boudabousia liubingyangii]|uniref:hypothetical protein n=1 Tax=Boudabousia liubingyangii TaxID=1921764 RepID=UPI000F79912A|nr:hypothetical protein [Boudabousia liubingyangii]